MQLRRLEVRNIRSYEEGRLEFPSGTTLIVGDVGAGKTSLLYAIEMALFGVAEVDAAYLVRHGATHAEVSVRFEDAEHSYEVFRRFRRLRRKGRETFESERIAFREDGRETSYSATEVRQRVIELLGFPDNPNPQAHSDLWRWAIYVPQERMREILSARPQERLETVRKALGVERYRIAAENALEVAADLRASARHRRESADRLAHFDLEFAEATESADRLRRDRSERAAEIVRSEEERDSARERSAAAERESLRLEAGRREAETLRRESAADEHTVGELRKREAERGAEVARRSSDRAMLEVTARAEPALRAASESAQVAHRGAVEELERHRSDVHALAGARAELAAARRQAQDAHERVERCRQHRQSAQAELDRADADGPVREPPPPTRMSLAEIEAASQAARAREHRAVERLSNGRRVQGEIEDLLKEGACPRCHQAVRPEEFAPHRAEAAAEVLASEQERTAAGAEVHRLDEERKSRERFERALERWTEVEKRREGLRRTLRQRQEETEAAEAADLESSTASERARARAEALAPAEAAVDRLRAVADAAEGTWNAARTALEEAVRAEDRLRALEDTLRALSAESERATRELEALELRRRERSARLAVLEKEQGNASEFERTLSELKARVAGLERRVAEEREQLVRTDTRLDGEVRRLAVAEKGRSERAGLVTEALDLEARAAWIVGPFRLALLEMEQTLLAHAHATFDRVFARYFASLVDDPALVARSDVGFTPEAMIEGEPTPAEALSGGERTALALAFRLALATVVRSLGEVRLESLLLDEPTDGFSSEQVVRMGELLSEIALPQVVMVSHEAQLASVADRTVRVRKVDGRAVLDGDGSVPFEPRSPPEPTRRRRAKVAPLGPEAS